MTHEQKANILQMRQDNRGYAAIAAALGLTKSQVSSFCRRNSQAGRRAACGRMQTMTSEQKATILQMRQDNRGYAAIAAALGLTKSQVSSFCRRNSQAGRKSARKPIEHTDGNYCRNCGKQLVQAARRKPLKFCSSECRVAWWNSHQDAVKKKAVYSFVCAKCGKPFTAYGNSKRKYCSHACYIAARFGGDRYV